MEPATLRGIIERGETVIRNATNDKPLYQPMTGWQKLGWFSLGFAVTSVIFGGLLFFLLPH